jgi:uncharacterized coiled-coil DUF342 family protein
MELTAKEINELKKLHNQYQEEGQKVYALVMDLHEKCTNLQKEIQEAEGEDYDPIPLIFGSGFWIDPDL